MASGSVLTKRRQPSGRFSPARDAVRRQSRSSSVMRPSLRAMSKSASGRCSSLSRGPRDSSSKPIACEILEVDDRLEHAGQLLSRHDRLELPAQAGADLIALRLDRLGGARDGVQQRALEADLGRLGEPRRADEEVDLGEQAALQLGLEARDQVLLEALLDDQQVLLGDEPGVTRGREDDEERVAQAGDGDEVLVADQVAARVLQALADDPIHVVDYLEPLQLLQRLYAADADVDDAELAVVEQHPLHLDLDVGQRGEPGDVVVVDACVPEDVGDRPQQVIRLEGLGDVGGGAGAARLHHVGQLGPRREEHDRDVLGVAELELPADLVAVHARHGDVQEDQVRVPGEGELEALLAAGRGEDLVAVRGQDGGDRCGEVVVVVDHQYPEAFVRHPLVPLRAGRRACQ